MAVGDIIWLCSLNLSLDINYSSRKPSLNLQQVFLVVPKPLGIFFNIDSLALLVAFHLPHTKSISSLRVQLISFHLCTCSAQYRA